LARPTDSAKKFSFRNDVFLFRNKNPAFRNSFPLFWNGNHADHPAHQYALGEHRMARPEVTGKKLPAAAEDVDAFSVGEFCRRHRISPQLFYKFRDEMPVTFRVGTLISREAAAAWRREREAEAFATTVAE
jgi:hypothetical protein